MLLGISREEEIAAPRSLHHLEQTRLVDRHFLLTGTTADIESKAHGARTGSLDVSALLKITHTLQIHFQMHEQGYMHRLAMEIGLGCGHTSEFQAAMRAALISTTTTWISGHL